MLYKGKLYIEYCDRRNAQYREKHKHDKLSENGLKARRFFERTSREQRANLHAKKIALRDIRKTIEQEQHVDDITAGKILNALFSMPKTNEIY